LLDLPDPLGGHAVLIGELLQRRRILLAQPPCLDDAPATRVERGQSALQALAASPLDLGVLQDSSGFVLVIAQVGDGSNRVGMVVGERLKRYILSGQPAIQLTHFFWPDATLAPDPDRSLARRRR